MRAFGIVFIALFLTSFAPAQTSGKLQAQCADIARLNIDRMKQGLRAVHPLQDCFPAPKTFGFTNKPSKNGLQEIGSMLAEVLNLTGQQVSFDVSAFTVTVHGTAAQLEMAGWLLPQLDLPADTPDKQASNAVVREFSCHCPNGASRAWMSTSSACLFSQTRRTRPFFREILTVLHTVRGLVVAGDAEQFGLAVRTQADQMGVVANLINSLDVAPGWSPGPAPLLRSWILNTTPASYQPQQEFYLVHIATPQGIRQMVSVLRTVAGIQKVFVDNWPPSVTVRGTVNDITTAEWLIQSLDIPTGPKAECPVDRQFYVHSAPQNDDVLRVFYMGRRTTPQRVLRLLDKLQSDQPDIRLASFATPSALVVRGTVAEIAKSELSILEALHTTP